MAERVERIVAADGAPAVRLHGAGTAELRLIGAQVWSFRPAGATHDLLWAATRPPAAGAPLRGGIPLCWPWLGADGGRGRQPFHGLLRQALWDLRFTAAEADGTTRAELGLEADAVQALGGPAARLTLAVAVSSRLDVTLRIENRSEATMESGGALHAYLAIGDVRRIRLHGLDGLMYHDADEEVPHRLQGADPVALDGLFSRTWHEVGDGGTAVVIDDPAWGRRLRLERRGSRALVGWNSGPDLGGRIVDIVDAWPDFVCLEPGNVDRDRRLIPPGGVHELGMTLALA